ncbi:cobalt ECF transporter T component CbiQ [Lachnoclostridium phytofermentans]|uniref:Cobalt ABC transporter, inner membrane subunit CbiQ n=1 Tax=Lachnoclostridium phytofermentans (strain ATCC 700394 / DSM 18823 / ISDg) TaxID=357809 RepID=A9KP96_LACP7|nr:cobalt ECF transporter T component CbiQ [Lachnoclostridium phytofermentans]ABX41758.1 cobalt ABC transporter, inner membrane subunit CbiQ [Lachnoclostridium phytofermentans ISDg]
MTKLIAFCTIFVVAVIFSIWEFRKKHVHSNSAHKHHHGIKHKHGEGFSIDLYAYTSHIRDWSSDFKVTFSVIVMILSIVLNNPYVSVVIIFAMAYITVVKGGLSITEYLSFLAIPLSFILLGTFTIAIDFSKEPIGQYNLYLGFCYVFTSLVQLKKMLFLILKVFAAVSALQMMTLSTPSSEIIAVLRKVHMPKLILELMNLIYRFIFILVDVYRQMKNSAEARQGYCDFRTSCITFGSIASNMLVVSLKKANAYYNAMEARCYDGELHFLEEKKAIKWNQLIAATAFIMFLFLLWGIM